MSFIKSDLKKGRSRLSRPSSSEWGFTFIEVLVALGLTTIVLGAVFSLLARGMRTSPAESQRSDLQAQARHALERLSADVLLAGTDLPIEFPAFTPPGINPDLDRQWAEDGPDAIEIIGHLRQDPLGGEPLRVVRFQGDTALLDREPVDIERGQLVLVYDDEPKHGAWTFGIVSSLQSSPQPAVTLVTESDASVGESRLPSFVNRYNRSRPKSGFLTPVTVVTYMVDVDPDADGDESPDVLWRQVNWGPPVQVAFVEDLQIRYFVGGPSSRANISFRSPTPGRDRPSGGTESEEYILLEPPVPQPNPAREVDLGGVVRGVRIQVTSRSHDANLEGSTVLPEQGTDEDGYLRVSYSTRIATRNLLFRLHAKQNLKGFN